MYEGLKVIGLSHDSSPIAIRESVAFSENENRIFLDRMREMLGVEEALIRVVDGPIFCSQSTGQSCRDSHSLCPYVSAS